MFWISSDLRLRGKRLWYASFMAKPSDLSGLRYGRLLVTSLVYVRPRRWSCVCDCGTVKIVQASALTSGNTKSCGCIHREQLSDRNRKHGMTDAPEYKIWQLMKARCRSNLERHKNYSGRGIKVCDRWNSFEAFIADMGPRPSPRHSIDRRDNSGDYEPGNCRWATPEQQMRNTRRNRLMTIAGVTRPLIEWCQEYKAPYHRTRDRMDRLGWPPLRALTQASAAPQNRPSPDRQAPPDLPA